MIKYIRKQKINESYGTSPSFSVPERLVQDITNTDLSQVMNNILFCIRGDNNEFRRFKGEI